MTSMRTFLKAMLVTAPMLAPGVLALGPGAAGAVTAAVTVAHVSPHGGRGTEPAPAPFSAPLRLAGLPGAMKGEGKAGGGARSHRHRHHHRRALRRRRYHRLRG
jgi:hypothetical protein